MDDKDASAIARANVMAAKIISDGPDFSTHQLVVVAFLMGRVQGKQEVVNMLAERNEGGL